MTLPTELSRGHVIRDGGGTSLPIPAAASGNVTVTDLATLTVAPSSAYLVLDDAVTRLSGVWAPGSGRWLVEYDVDGSEEPPPVNIFPGLVEDDELAAKMAAVAAGDNAFSVTQRAASDARYSPLDRFRTQESGAANPTGENVLATETGRIHSGAGASVVVGGSSAPYENVIGGDTSTVSTTTSNVPAVEPTLTPAPSWNALLGGYDNVVNGWANQVQGYHCKVEENASHGTISGGSMHTIDRDVDYATIGGGNQNHPTGDGATIAGGLENTAGSNGSVLGGRLNQATGSNASIGGGNQCVASNSYSTVAGGLRNQATGPSAAVVGGQDNAATGTAATVIGRDSTASGAAATAMGRDALANLSGQVAQSSGKFAAQGDAQASRLTARCETTDATPKPLLLDSTSGHIVIPVDTTWQFDVSVVARGVTVDESAAYKFTGCIKRDATGASTALVGSVVNLLTAEQVPGWDVSVVADTTSVSLRILATGEAGKTIRWVARVDLVQVTC